MKLTADRNLLPVYQPPLERINTPEFASLLRRLQPDLLVSMHYGVIFSRDILSIPPLGCVNEHPSRMPAGRGMTPSFWHMLIGDTHNWITLHYLDEGIDTGPIISQGSVVITPDDTGATSSHKLSEVGRRIFRDALPLIRQGTAPRIPHDQIKGVKGSYYSWKPSYARISWDWPAEKIALHVRTLTPAVEARSGSGSREAYAFLAGHRVRVWEAKAAQGNWAKETIESGRVVAVAGEGLLVKSGQGAVVLTAAAIEGMEHKGLDGLIEILVSGLPATFG